MPNPEMSAPMLSLPLRHIRLIRATPALQALADEIGREYPDDKATPRLLASLRALTAIQPKGPRDTLLAPDGAEGAF